MAINILPGYGIGSKPHVQRRTKELVDRANLEIRILALEAKMAILTGDKDDAEKYKLQMDDVVAKFKESIAEN